MEKYCLCLERGVWRVSSHGIRIDVMGPVVSSTDGVEKAEGELGTVKGLLSIEYNA